MLCTFKKLLSAFPNYQLWHLTWLILQLYDHSSSFFPIYQVDNNPYDPSLMVFMDYRDYVRHDAQSLEAKYPTFLYAMPMTKTRVFFEVSF